MPDPQGPAQPAVTAVTPLNTTPAPRQLADRTRLAEAARGSLDTVHALAVDWRTGMAGLLTLVTGTLLFQGKSSINDYPGWVQVVLGVLVVSSLAAGVVSLLLFLTAAHGRPKPMAAAEILDQGLDVYNVGLAQVALADLKRARALGVASAALLAGALLFSWYGTSSAAASPSPVAVTLKSGSPVCGQLKGLNGTTTVLQIAGEPTPRSLATSDILGMRVVAAC